MDSSNYDKTDASLKRCRNRVQLFAQRWCSRRCLLALLLVTVASMVVCSGRIHEGAKLERLALSAAPEYVVESTTADNKVCGMKDPKNVNSKAETFETSEDAKAANIAIVHCEHCGHCSTAQDMKALVKHYHPHQTGPAVEPTSTCALTALLLGSSTYCRNNNMPRGLSAGCHDCYTTKAACVYEHCKYMCILQQSWWAAASSPEEGTCEECQQTMCQAEFLKCSGATRKRMGIVSGHGSSTSTNHCKKVNYDWMRGVHIKMRPTRRRRSRRLGKHGGNA